MIINPLSDVTLYPLSSQEAVSAATDEERLVKIHNVIQQLPPPHYRSGSKLDVAPWWTEVELFDFCIKTPRTVSAAMPDLIVFSYISTT